MPPKKDGQPPPKPKPEELISEFKDKFEVFSTETKKGFEEVEKSLVDVRETQADLEKLTETIHFQEEGNVNELVANLSEQILLKFANTEKEVKNEFLKLEGSLQGGQTGRQWLQRI